MKKLIALVLTLMFTLTAVAALAEAPATTDTNRAGRWSSTIPPRAAPSALPI